jgi:hypothetical protein
MSGDAPAQARGPPTTARSIDVAGALTRFGRRELTSAIHRFLNCRLNRSTQHRRWRGRYLRVTRVTPLTFLPRMDGAGCPPGGRLRFMVALPRLCQELRTQELAGVLWPTWRRFDPSSSPSAIDLGSLLSSAVNLPQNPQQTEIFQVNDCTGDYRRDGNLRLETTFFSKASYFAVLVQL